MRKRQIVEHETAARRIEDALRMRVGRGRRYSFDGLSDATGIPKRTLESYTQGATPGLSAFLSICAALGPSFTSDVLEEVGQVARDSGDADPEHVRVLSELGHMVRDIADALEDGHVDHREAAAMRPVAANLIEMLEPMARINGGAA